MKLSKQALGALMMALQKSLIEQTDIVPVLESFNFQLDDGERLTVVNPPSFEINNTKIEEKETATSGSD